MNRESTTNYLNNYRIKLDRSIICINIILYRADAFLNTLYDLTIVLIGIILFLSRAMYVMHTSLGQFLEYFLLIPFYIHFLYAIVYVVNDYVDYEKVIHYPLEKFIYYIYRPTIFFNKSLVILICLNSLYIFLGFVLIEFLKLPIIIHIPLIPFFAIISLLRSRCANTNLRHMLFSSLRLMKYLCAAIALESLLFQNIPQYFFFIILIAFLVPYTIYRTVEYMILSKDLSFDYIKALKGKIRALALLIIGMVLSIFTFSYYYEHSFNSIRGILFAYITCSFPIMCSYLLSPLLIKKLSRDGFINSYHILLLKRLVDFFLTLLFATSIVHILKFIY
jgi:hypothetical protein